MPLPRRCKRCGERFQPITKHNRLCFKCKTINQEKSNIIKLNKQYNRGYRKGWIDSKISILKLIKNLKNE